MDPVWLMALAWLFVLVWVSIVIVTQRKHHPRALFILFFAELWERFSYYGMRALLTLYMAKELLYSDEKTMGIYGAYGALVYATPVLGGFLAEKVFGYRWAIVFGGVLMTLGHFVMAVENEFFFFMALALLILGNGFFKPNISSFVGQLYQHEEEKKDKAFTIFYMGINVGAFLAPLTCGLIGEEYGWHYGFGLAGVGMLVGLIVFMWGMRSGQFNHHGLMPDKKPWLGSFKNHWLVVLVSLAMLPVFMEMLQQDELAKEILLILGLIVFAVLFVIALRQEKVQRERLFVVMILAVFSVLFWSFFEQAGSSLTLFTDRNVDRMVNGGTLPVSIFQSVNPFFIIILVPVFTWLWGWLASLKWEPSAPVKFSFGILQLGLGFLALVWGAHGFLNGDGLVPLIFLILAYFLHTTGEMCLSPIGLSLVTKLSPKKMVGFVMGVWFLSVSFAHVVGVYVAQLTSKSGAGVSTSSLSSQESVLVYSGVFENVGLVAIGSAILLFALSPLLKKWMHGVS